MDGIDRILRSPPRLDQLIRPRFGNLPVALRRSRSCRERGLYLRRSEREGEAGLFTELRLVKSRLGDWGFGVSDLPSIL
jgi:hypothetical protein